MENTEKIGSFVEKPSILWPGKIAVAPMMDWTDRHCRYFLRGFSPRVLLYTEMITAAAILRGDRDRLLRFHPEERPIALQVGGSEPASLARAAAIGADFGYGEINLNCGCPSDRVHSGAFGACLMRDPRRVADCVAAMRAAVRIPVTVKMRIGVVEGGTPDMRRRIAEFDEADSAALEDFVRQVRDAGCAAAIVHARKALLGGWSPKENRDIPPLRYDVVQRLKRSCGALPVILNGGLRTGAAISAALEWSDGVMLGREAYHNPMILAELDRRFLGDPGAALPTRAALLERMAGYAEAELARGERLSSIARHMLGLCTRLPHAREFRRLLSEDARAPDAGPELFRRAARLCEAPTATAA
jgi:tRNA-dihydrouridine synthase A